MTTSRATIAISAVFLLSACAPSPKTTEPAQSPAAAEASSAVVSFASYIQGDWTCDKVVDSGADLAFPVFGVDSLYESEISIGDGTWSASWGKEPEDKAAGTSKIDGREISLTSPLGTQTIANLPETPDQALEPMKLRITDTDNNVTIQVRGERTVTIKSGSGSNYISECTKF